jgi:hypothetical protein
VASRRSEDEGSVSDGYGSSPVSMRSAPYLAGIRRGSPMFVMHWQALNDLSGQIWTSCGNRRPTPTRSLEKGSPTLPAQPGSSAPLRARLSVPRVARTGQSRLSIETAAALNPVQRSRLS